MLKSLLFIVFVVVVAVVVIMVVMNINSNAGGLSTPLFLLYTHIMQISFKCKSPRSYTLHLSGVKESSAHSGCIVHRTTFSAQYSIQQCGTMNK